METSESAKIEAPPVTVVSGLPRSGTSMMMQMLAAGGMPVLTDGLRAADLDNPRGYFEFEPVKRTARDPGWLAAAPGKAVKVVHFLLDSLPTGYQYRVLLMRRDIGQVVASQELMLRHLGRRGANLSPEQLAEILLSQLRRAREWLALQPNIAVLDVDYRSVIEDPAGQTNRINQFLGGSLNPARMAAAVDPSLNRQR